MPVASAGRCEVAARARASQLLFPGRGRHDLVDQPPVERAAATHPLFRSAEHIGQVAAHPALVGEAGQPAGAGQDAEQRYFGQGHRRAAVVDQRDPVAGRGQFVAAARRGAADSGEIALAGMLGGILDRETRLVGESAEIDLVAVRRLGKRADIGAGAEHVVLTRADHDAAHLGMLETQPLHRIGQLDIDPEIVGIELQFGAGEQAAGGIDIERQRRHGPFAGETPMPIAAGLGRKIDAHAGNITPIPGFRSPAFAKEAQIPTAVACAGRRSRSESSRLWRQAPR
jgi:hypothetical protein